MVMIAFPPDVLVQPWCHRTATCVKSDGRFVAQPTLADDYVFFPLTDKPVAVTIIGLELGKRVGSSGSGSGSL